MTVFLVILYCIAAVFVGNTIWAAIKVQDPKEDDSIPAVIGGVFWPVVLVGYALHRIVLIGIFLCGPLQVRLCRYFTQQKIEEHKRALEQEEERQALRNAQLELARLIGEEKTC